MSNLLFDKGFKKLSLLSCAFFTFNFNSTELYYVVKRFNKHDWSSARVGLFTCQ